MAQVLKLYFLLLVGTIYSQDSIKIKSIHNNEIRFNAIKYGINNRIEISYERFLNKVFSVGVTSINQEDKFDKQDYKITAKCEYVNEYQITPFFRYSNTINKLDNLYVEAFSSINGGRFKRLERIENEEFAYYTISQNKYLNVAVGASLGAKFYILKRISVDTYFGFGANINRKNSETPAGIARIGISFGYKF